MCAGSLAGAHLKQQPGQAGFIIVTVAASGLQCMSDAPVGTCGPSALALLPQPLLQVLVIGILLLAIIPAYALRGVSLRRTSLDGKPSGQVWIECFRPTRIAAAALPLRRSGATPHERSDSETGAISGRLGRAATTMRSPSCC